MGEFELNTIWQDRYGDYEIIENDGTGLIAKYINGPLMNELKIFNRHSFEVLLRIHNNIEEEKKRARSMLYGSVVRDSTTEMLEIFKRAPKENVIVGRDNDSIFCAILMQKAYDSKVVGMFDATTLRKNTDVDLKECLFLDIEIFNENYYSIGNHLNCIHPDCFRKNFLDSTKNCMNANILNRISAKDYDNKYPFGTNVLLLLMIEKLGKRPGELGIDKKWLFNSIAHSDGTANSMFNDRYMDNTYHWVTEFFGDTETSNNYLLPIYDLGAWKKKAASVSFNIKTHVKKSKIKGMTDLTDFFNHVVYIHHCMGLEFDPSDWPLFDCFDSTIQYRDHCSEKKHEIYKLNNTHTEDLTKGRNIHLYLPGSKMVTSCIRSGENMDYSEDVNNVFGG